MELEALAIDIDITCPTIAESVIREPVGNHGLPWDMHKSPIATALLKMGCSVPGIDLEAVADEEKQMIQTEQKLNTLKSIFKYTDQEATAVLDYYQWDEVLALIIKGRSRIIEAGVFEMVRKHSKLRYEMLTLLRNKIKRNMKFYQPYPTKIVIEGEAKRLCWWKIKFPYFSEEMVDCIFPDRGLFYTIQPKASYRPKSTVTMYKVEERQYGIAFGLTGDLITTSVNHSGKLFKAKIADYVLLRYSKKKSRLDIIYKLNIYTSDGVKIDTHIQPRYLKLGRPKTE